MIKACHCAGLSSMCGSQAAMRPHEAALVQASRQQPQALAVVHQHLHARAALVGKQVGVVQACGTKDFDHAAQGFVGPGAHVQRCRGQPQRVDADHVGGLVSSQPLAQPGTALGCGGCRPLQAHGAGASAQLQADGLSHRLLARGMGTSTKALDGANADTARPLRPAPSRSQRRTRLALRPCASATPATEAPGCWQARIDLTLEIRRVAAPGALRWSALHSVHLSAWWTLSPGVDADKLSHQQLLRSMDALMDHQDAVNDTVAHLLRPLIDEELSVVFYDLTTIRAQGLSEQGGDVRRFGMSKEGLIARQFMLGVVQTADGMPIHHEVFAGNAAEAPTLLPMLGTLLKRYPHIRRLVIVADRGLLSLDNVAALSELKLPSGQPMEFILAVPGRRYSEFAEVLQAMQAKMADASCEVIEETRWGEHRLVIAHDPVTAQEQSAQRQGKIDALHVRAAELAGKLDAQDDGVMRRGRKLSDSGAKARFFHEVSDAHLSRIIKVDLQSDVFTYALDTQALQRAALMDGKLMLVTNVADLSATEVVQRYKALADIERGFKVLKSEIEIAPVFHRLPERIKAHASICFMALILYRVMRQRLKLAGSPLSPEAALASLRRIQRHSVSIDNGAPVSGISSINQDQAATMAALKVKKLSNELQLSLL
jgi:hypothetical protein